MRTLSRRFSRGAQLARSTVSTRHVKLIAANLKGPTVVQNMGFYGGVVAAYCFTEQLTGAIRGGHYDSWNAVPGALMAGIGIGIRGAHPGLAQRSPASRRRRGAVTVNSGGWLNPFALSAVG